MRVSAHRFWPAVVAALLGLAPVAAAADDSLLLATTTSVRDSGLLDALLPAFRERSGIRVQVVAVGTGAALRMGAEGNADVLLTHAPTSEAELVATGAVVDRRPFMQNHFVLAGPAADPAAVREAETPEAALQRIAALPAAFVSRADDSGTHKREVALLRAAGLPEAGGWEGFAKTGTGMGLTLQVAGERGAYVLSDIGTFLAFRERTELVVLSRPADSLRNVYSVLRVNPERFSRVNARGARALEEFLLEEAVRERIADFGRERFGRPLFVPLQPAVAETRD
ncbi:MAG: substrate-binding domain-containing protein [Deltaproteobacteria bacterium]|nr:substrate-binding domain-containing protein [Deltaproteobacteria bacterium]